MLGHRGHRSVDRSRTGAAPALAATLAVGVLLLIAPDLSLSLPRAPSLGAIPPSPTPTDARADHPLLVAVASAPAAVHPSAMVLGQSAVTPSAISLNWTAVTAFVFGSYTVSYSTNGSGGPWTSAGVLTSQSTTRLAVAGLSPGATYWWEVVASYWGGSSTSNVLMQAQPTLAYLNYTYLSASQAQINWTNNATYGGLISFDAYSVYEAVGTAAPTLLKNLTNVDTRTYTVSGLSSGTSYRFFLNTSDCYSGCGAAGALLSITESNAVTLGTPLPLLASVSATRPVVDIGELDFYTCTPSGGQSPFSFSWMFGSGNYTNGTGSESHAFAANGSQIVSCLVLDATHTRSSAATTIVVNTDPVLNANANRTTADINQLIGFSCSAQGGTSAYTLAWAFGDGSEEGSPTGLSSHSYTGAAQYIPTCTVQDGAGVQAARSFALLVSPALQTRAGASAAAVAPGTSVAFSSTPANGSGVYSNYTWEFGDGQEGYTAQPGHTYANPGAYTAQLRVTDSNGGSATATVAVQVSSIVVTLGTLPSSAHTGDAVTFTVGASGGAGAPFNYTWEFGDGSVGFGATVHHHYTKTGVYSPSVQVTDHLGAAVHASAGTLQVALPPPPYNFFTGPVILAIAALVGAALAIGAFWYRRRPDERLKRNFAGYVPPADPSKTVQGVKLCRTCGTANLPIRESCANCGAGLPRNPIH
ncbi:MAG TPA: PKD domain-containing protein [Thermoplasmata archaeon]|nr:PKD domain-containing protein [Thermoplasmata archaeon]